MVVILPPTEGVGESDVNGSATVSGAGVLDRSSARLQLAKDDALNHSISYRSTSPNTMSKVPITATTSATNAPSTILLSA